MWTICTMLIQIELRLSEKCFEFKTILIFSVITNTELSHTRLGLSRPHILGRKDVKDVQKIGDLAKSNNNVRGNTNETQSSSMPILEDPSQENLDLNWVRTILQEKERQLNNNSGCDVHEKCISTQKIKVRIWKLHL